LFFTGPDGRLSPARVVFGHLAAAVRRGVLAAAFASLPDSGGTIAVPFSGIRFVGLAFDYCVGGNAGTFLPSSTAGAEATF
jgi:predicted GNAT superfamily acetyltransferase